MDAEPQENEPFLEGEKDTVPRPSQRSTFIPWLLTALSWLCTSYLLVSRDFSSSAVSCSSSSPSLCQCNTTIEENTQTCNGSWPTDLKAMQHTVSYEQRRFTGELTYDKSTKLIVRNNTASFFGPPSDAIDSAWNELLHGEWPPFKDEEAALFSPLLVPLPVDGKYHFEPDMFHSLHCLNAIRMHIDDEYYSQPGHDGHDLTRFWPQADFKRIHIDHCMDQIRQGIMCHGDLSPTPIYSWEGMPLALGRGSLHTCRKWEPVREWVDQRNREMNNTLQDY